MRQSNPLTDNDLAWIDRLSPDELAHLYKNAIEIADAERKQPLDFFTPYPKQFEFFKLGATKRERLFQAGNQTGKSKAGAAETAMHLTGHYPDWFPGKRFTHPVRVWIAGESGSALRDAAQTHLFGPPGVENAFGLISPELIVGNPSASHGTTGLYDTVRIRHISGGVSTLTTKTYEQERGKWQGATLELLWLDEEPPPDLYSEGIMRLTGEGMLFCTFTPLRGRTAVVERFLHDPDPESLSRRGVIRMSLDEAEHFTAQEKADRISGIPLHERDARMYGEPLMGEGAVFTTPTTAFVIDQNIKVPMYWSKLWGIDFGSRVFAAVLMAWDRDSDVIYVLDTVRLENSRPIEHVSAMKRIAGDIRVAWPQDGHSTERGTGETIVSQYKPHGLLMLPDHASHPDGGFSVEAGILDIQERIADGRFRVRAHCADWFEEYRGYFRKDGRIVKARDHLLDATRYAMMMKRFAKPGMLGDASGRRPGYGHQPFRVIREFDLFSAG